MRRKIVKVGNSLAVTLPRQALADLGLREGDSVDVDVADGHILIGQRQDLKSLFAAWPAIGRRIRTDQIVDAIREDRNSR